MNTDGRSLAAAWREAATDLDIRVTAPFTLIADDGQAVELAALVHDFGSGAGALVASTGEDHEGLQGASRSGGYFLSLLNAEYYGEYERELYVETLNDWGYFGEAAAPGWYTGAQLRRA